MDADEGFEDEGPFSPWVAPDDRLWRHPSESSGAPTEPFAVRPPTPRSRPSLPRPWATALIAGVVGALLASGIGVASGGFVHTTVVRPITGLISPSPTTEADYSANGPAQPTASWSAVYDQLAPAMVLVSGSSDAGEAYSSGMLWTSSTSGETDYILAAGDDLQGLSSVTVTFADGTAPGKVIGTDADTGLAVISVTSRKVPSGTTWPTPGSLTDIHVGDNLATVGPATAQSGSFADGSVSSLYQTINTQDGNGSMVGLIAVDTAGQVNTGAALVDTQGQVVGLTVEDGPPSTASSSQDYAYAVPMDVATTVGTELINNLRPWHPWIGVLQAQDFPAASAMTMGYAGGASVVEVSPGSPAAQAGLVPTDVIVRLGNTQIDSTGELLDALDQCRYDSSMPLVFLQGGKPITRQITITSQPNDPASS